MNKMTKNKRGAKNPESRARDAKGLVLLVCRPSGRSWSSKPKNRSEAEPGAARPGALKVNWKFSRISL